MPRLDRDTPASLPNPASYDENDPLRPRDVLTGYLSLDKNRPQGTRFVDVPEEGLYDIWIQVVPLVGDAGKLLYEFNINDETPFAIRSSSPTTRERTWLWHKGHVLKQGANTFNFNLANPQSDQFIIKNIRIKRIVDPDELLLPFGFPEEILRMGGWPDYYKMTDWNQWTTPHSTPPQ